MDEKLERQVKKYEEMLMEWALERKLIKTGQEIKISARIRQIVPAKRWELTGEEWDTILSLPWTESKRGILEVLRKSDGKPLPMKSVRLPRNAKWGRFGKSPSESSYYGINVSLATAGLPFHISCYYYEGDRFNRVVRIAALSHSS